MLIDLSLRVTKEHMKIAMDYGKMEHLGHLGTHFDVMDKEFPLEYTSREAIVFDVSDVEDRDIEISDIDINKVKEGMFVAFYTDIINKLEYATKEYFEGNRNLSKDLITELVKRGASIIAIDCCGIRAGKEHDLADQYCADHNTFVVENLCNLEKVLNGEKDKLFKVNTYPIKFVDITGLPCRVIAEL